jgi:antitoxin component YwqK of YwqJK toxin-antitoxin module
VRWKSTFVNGVEEGARTDYHPTGEILHQGIYKHGLPWGTHDYRSADGKKLFGSSTIVEGTGDWKAYSPDGVVVEDGSYLQGQRDGLWIMYRETGTKELEIGYHLGELEGVYHTYHKSGEPLLIGMMHQGHRAGTWIAIYDNGNPEWMGAYDNEGNRTGPWWNYRWGGQLESAGPMFNDVRQGIWMLFQENGQLAAVGPYENDQKTGKWTEFWEHGEYWREAMFLEDVEDVPAARVCEAKRGDWAADYEKRALGCRVCRAKPDDSIMAVGIGHWTWWHPNGVIEKEGDLLDGKPDGHWIFNFDNGKPMLEGTYTDAKEGGPWAGYYRAGEKRFKGGYREGDPDGDWISWYPDGKVLSQGHYDAGKKTGHWLYYDQSGAKKDDVDMSKAPADPGPVPGQ